MALPIGSGTNWDDDGGGGEQEWEICNDNGFIYKRRCRRRRRRRLADDDPHQSPPCSSSARNREAAARRARKKKTLLSLRDKYRGELDQWEQLSASLAQIAGAAGPTETPSDGKLPAPPPLPASSVPTKIDEMLLQVEAQESMIRKLSELCDYANAVLEAEEERMSKTLMELPIWGSPRRLIASLKLL